VPDGGWHALDCLREQGPGRSRWRASATCALTARSFEQAVRSDGPRPSARGVPNWRVGAPAAAAAAPAAVRPGDIVYVRGASIVNAPHLVDHRVLARVKDVTVRAGAGADVRCVQPHRDIRTAAPLRNGLSSGETTRFFCDTSGAIADASAVPMHGSAPSRYPARLVETAAIELGDAAAPTLARELATAVRLCSDALWMSSADAERARHALAVLWS
jgi:hypothetical protein